MKRPASLQNGPLRAQALKAAKRLRAVDEALELGAEQRTWLAELVLTLANRLPIQRPQVARKRGTR